MAASPWPVCLQCPTNLFDVCRIRWIQLHGLLEILQGAIDISSLTKDKGFDLKEK